MSRMRYINAAALILLCLTLASCGSVKTAGEKTSAQTDRAAVSAAADTYSDSGADDVSLEHMPFYEQSGYASEASGGICNAYEIDENNAEYGSEIILSPMDKVTE